MMLISKFLFTKNLRIKPILNLCAFVSKNKRINFFSTKSSMENKEGATEECKNFGNMEMVQSQERTNKVWVPLAKIDDSYDAKEVLIRGRVHNVRGKGNLAFVIIRQNVDTLQSIAFKSETIPKAMLKFISNVPKESIVDITGKLTKPDKPIESCSVQLELQISTFFVVDRARSALPFQIEDACRPLKEGEDDMDEEEKEETQEASKDGKTMPRVLMKTRLDNRIIDLRTQTKQAIFTLSSGVCMLFREFLLKNDFMEIRTPKLIGGASEGGSNVFKLKYFNKDACLAQSPQLYKQMCVMADFERVFEVSPVFRAENSFTHRHMCEFTGLDLEMSIKEHYFEILDMCGELFVYIFKGIEERYAKQLDVIRKQFPFEPLKCSNPVLKITFEEGVNLLNEAGFKQDLHEDLDSINEKTLGKLVREKYDTDFYILHKYPISARPFYTMLNKEDPKFTNSYDFFIRGEEITSGAQRIHDPDFLAERAKQCGIEVPTIQDYIDSFKFGAFPHGGVGIGLERIVFLYCNLKNIRNSSMFPRDPKRVTP